MIKTYELSFVVPDKETAAGPFLESLTEQICAATGGSGEGDHHVCHGFVAGWIRGFES